MDKDVVPIHNGILFSHKNKRNPAIAATWMELGGIIAQWNKENIIWFHLFVEYKNKAKWNKTAVDSALRSD